MKNFENFPKVLKLILFISILLLNTINGITQNEIRVLATRGKTAIINAGSSSGIMKDEKYYLNRVTENGVINVGIVKVVIVKQRKAAIKSIESNESNNIKKNDILGDLYEDTFDGFFNETPSSQGSAIDKGSKIISGMGSYASQGGDLFEYYGDRTTTITLVPILNYFVAPNISIGGSVAYTHQSQGDNSSHSLGIGPTLSYFIGNSNSKSYPFLAVGIRYFSTGGNDDPIPGTDIVIGGGVIAPVRGHIGIVIEAGYHIINLKHKDWDRSVSGNIFMIGIGVAGLLY